MVRSNLFIVAVLTDCVYFSWKEKAIYVDGVYSEKKVVYSEVVHCRVKYFRGPSICQ